MFVTKTTQTLLGLGHVHRLHLARNRVHDDLSLVLRVDKLLVGQSVLLVVLRVRPASHTHLLSVRCHLNVVGVRRRVLRRLPHHHDAEEQQEVVDAPNAVVDPSAHDALRFLQPLVLPHRVRVIVYDDVAEADQRERRQDHAHHQQITQLREHLQLGDLLLLHQLVHRVH